MNQANTFPQSRGLSLHWWGEFAVLSMLLMETCWIADWYNALVRPQAGLVATCLYIGLALVATHLLARVLAVSHLRMAWRRILFLAWLALALLAGFAFLVYGAESLSLGLIAFHLRDTFILAGSELRAFWHIMFMLLIQFHAIHTAREPLQVYTVQANFQLGLFLLLIYGLIFSWLDPGQALVTTYGFLFFAMAGMSSTRISTLSGLRGGRLPRLQSPWLLGILATAGAVTGLAILIGYISTNFAADGIAFLVSALLTILLIAGVVILAPLLLVLLALGPSIRSLLENLSRLAIFTELWKYINTGVQSLGIDTAWIESVARTGRPVVLLSVLAGILVIILASLVWKPWKRRLVVEESTINLPLRAALRFPRLFLNRFSGRLPSEGRLLAAARIRWVYTQLLHLCSRLGKPRRPAITPLEYLPLIQPLFPGEEATLAAITQSYLKVRYGELPETFEEVQDVLLGWERLRILGKQMLKARKKWRIPMGSGQKSSESG